MTAGDVTLVGIEGGEHAAYREPPYYDPKALSGGRVIVGAFNTGTDLPRGRTRVARLMVRVRGDVAPVYAATVQAAAGADARSIAAKVSVSERAEKASWHGRPAHDSRARTTGGSPVPRQTAALHSAFIIPHSAFQFEGAER